MRDVLSILVIAIMLASLIYPILRKGSASLTIAIGLFAIFMLELVTSRSGIIVTSRLFIDLAFSPAYLTSGDALYTVFTSIFLHASFTHIIFNVVALVFIGIFLEERIGNERFLTIFIISGIVGSLTFGLANFGNFSFAIGASGSISGILGAIGILYPRQGFMILFLPIKNIPAWVIVLGFLAIQLYLAMVPGSLIAWEAHVGGLAAGLAIAPLVVRFQSEERATRGEKVNIMLFATTPEEKEIANRIRSESMREVRTAWMEQLVTTAKCPLCGARIRVYRGRIKCRNGHKFNV